MREFPRLSDRKSSRVPAILLVAQWEGDLIGAGGAKQALFVDVGKSRQIKSRDASANDIIS